MRRALLILLVLFAAPLFAQSEVSYHNENAPEQNLDRWRFALQGYDPVAYFEYGEPTEGLQDYVVEHEKARYLFASKISMDKFSADPERYLPAYGGWCAYGLGMKPDEVSDRKPGKYPIDPKTYKIIDGRLHLFFNDGEFNALEHWNQDEEGYKARADEVWQAMNQQE